MTSPPPLRGVDSPASFLTPLGVTVSRPDRVFPTLTPTQIARIAPHGRQRAIRPGDVLVEAGQRPVPFFVVLSGEVQALRPSAGTETLIVRQGAGQFTGEGTMLTGRRALNRIRATEPGAVIELDREQLLGLIQTDAELSELLMRAFVLRRVELIAGGFGDVVVIGSTHCAGTLRVEEFLTQRSSVPLYRSRPRSGRPGAPRSFSCDDRRRASADLPRRCGAAESKQPTDRRLPGIQ